MTLNTRVQSSTTGKTTTLSQTPCYGRITHPFELVISDILRMESVANTPLDVLDEVKMHV
jgi:hypothetical protein